MRVTICQRITEINEVANPTDIGVTQYQNKVNTEMNAPACLQFILLQQVDMAQEYTKVPYHAIMSLPKEKRYNGPVFLKVQANAGLDASGNFL